MRLVVMWWPSVTVDVLRSDLRRLEVREESVVDLRADDEDFVSDWVWVERENEEQNSPNESLLNPKETVSSVRTRIDVVRFRMCMGTFDAMALAAGLGEQLTVGFSPLDFCREELDQKSAVLCVNVSSQLSDHLLDREWTEPAGSKQDAKDIARDSVVVNGGAVLTGADLEYDEILKKLSQQLENNNKSAALILSVACRTFSGGTVFEEVLRFFPNQMVAPVSRDAAPLDIVLVQGKGCLIRAHTRYALQKEEEEAAGKTACTSYLNGYCFAELALDNLAVANKSRAFVYLVAE